VSKTPNHVVDQFQTLEESYQELKMLRLRVHQAEQANEKAIDVTPKAKRNSAQQKQLADKWPR
jgi:hypothetical protein